MTLAEARNKEPPSSLPKLNPGDYSLLWCNDFWDGPISGLLSYGGQEYWFEMIQENEREELAEGQWYRRYSVVMLTTEQLAREHEVHQDFRLYVCDYSPESGRQLQPRDRWHLFYDRHLEYCRRRKFEDCKVVAWFEN